MIVREYTDADFEAIKKLHQDSGFGYDLSALSGEEFYSRRVTESKEGIAMGAFLRLTSEVYLIANPEWRNPAWRMEALKQLHTVSVGDARSKGVREIMGFLPPQLESRFGNRLARMGWNSYKGPEWRCYGLEVI